jgi:hypothetical protein
MYPRHFLHTKKDIQMLAAAEVFRLFNTIEMVLNISVGGLALNSMSLNTPPASFFSMTGAVCERRLPANMPLPDLIVSLPLQQYRTVKIVAVPFDPRVSGGGKFGTLTEAMLFIGRHCLFHHKSFTRSLMRLYLPFCKILDLAQGCYVSPHQLPKRDVDAEFSAAARVLLPRR